MKQLWEMLVLIRGGGDLGSGVAHRLHRSGFRVVVTELPQPLVIRRAVAFANAVYEGHCAVEGVEARLVRSVEEVGAILSRGMIPVLMDPEGRAIPLLRPDVVVDARLAKRNLGTTMADAPIVIGLGPGFVAGQDVHAVIETQRGHDLGRMILQGCAAADTSVPGLVQGYGRERVLWAPKAGVFRGQAAIGDAVAAGQVVAHVEDEPVLASIGGVLRGLLHDGLSVGKGQKVGDIDPRGVVEHCFTISDKSRAIGGGVLEAILYLLRDRLPASSNSRGP